VKKALIAAVAAAAVSAASVFGLVVVSAGVIATTSEDAVAAPIGPSAVCTVTVDGAGTTLTGVQLGNFQKAMAVGASAGVPERGHIVMVATAMQESGGRNLASRAVPESMRYPNDGVAAGDHDSINMFQQRRPWWGPGGVRDGMNLERAARQFYGGADDTPGIPGLLDIKGWQSMSIAQAAQAVQRSAFPDAYAKWEPLARAVVDGSSITCQDATSGATGPWVAPMKPGTYRLTSDFGPRSCSGCSTYHNGIDLAAPAGTPIYAPAAGKVIYAGWMTKPGNIVEIDHGGGIVTRHLHQSRIVARVGQVVTPGQLIGYVGNTGQSFGAHLHFETRINGTAVDPYPFMKQKGVTL